MNKSIILLLGIGAFSFISAQKNDQLKYYFKKQHEANTQKFNSLFKKNSNKRIKQILDNEQNLAGFLDNTPIFWVSDDRRGNLSANVNTLQDGSFAGLNSIPVTGLGQNIIVMDGGRVFSSHNEFGGPTNGPTRVTQKEAETVAFSSHATNVSGIIGAIGVGNFALPYGASGAKGVLTGVNFDSYSFSTTALGTNIEKLTNAQNANISNHSYGTNLGWSYKSATEGSLGEGWYFPFDNYSTNPADTFSGSYYTNDQNFDRLVYSNPNHIIIKSSGNYYGDGPEVGDASPKFRYNNATSSYVAFDPGESIPLKNCTDGYYCIGWGSLAKNIITVGATYQLTTADNEYTSSADVIKTDFSSTGPRKDGAIKPDITAVGASMVVASYTSPTTYNNYGVGGGTSYSAPIISGIAGALTEIQRRLIGNNSIIFRADEMKAIFAHTANEAGNPGPDVWYGWGFADAEKGASLLISKANNLSILERNTLTSGVKYTKNLVAKAGEPLKATISWVDPAAVPFNTVNDLFNNHASRLVNDLDLRLIDTSNNTIYYPWKLDVSNPMANATKGDNLVDNVEQVIIENPVAGRTYRLEVSNKGKLVNDENVATPQNYTLIATGYDATLETSEANLERLITVYPTKTKDIVTILIPEGGKSIEVFDLSGKSVSKTNAKKSQTIDISKLPKGIYIFNIKTEKGTISKKVIKE